MPGGSGVTSAQGEHPGEGSTKKGSSSPFIPAPYGVTPGKWPGFLCVDFRKNNPTLRGMSTL